MEEEKIAEELIKMIERKRKEKQILDIIYELFPNIPAETLANTVRETIEQYKLLNDLYKK